MFPIYKYGPRRLAGADWDRKYVVEEASSADPETLGRQLLVRTMLRHLPARGRVLDAGCGTGGLAGFLSRRGFTVSGVDTSATAVEIARKVAPSADLRVASIEALPFPEGSFDTYLAIGSWEYLPDGPGRAAAEAARVVKPGGLAFIEVPNANGLRRTTYLPLKRIEGVLRTLGGQQLTFSHHLFRVAELQTLLRRHGFTMLETHPHDLPEATRHYGLWVDWPPLRRGPRYELNLLGRAVKLVGSAISLWTIATGMFIVARKA